MRDRHSSFRGLVAPVQFERRVMRAWAVAAVQRRRVRAEVEAHDRSRQLELIAQTSSDLQQSLPNVAYTKTNFTASTFTIRGIGDLCTGFSCDSATGIHVNDMPLTSTRLFETEYFDLERIEVLRGPQGTLFGRNATSGVVNFITARPTSDIHAISSADMQFESMKLTAWSTCDRGHRHPGRGLLAQPRRLYAQHVRH